MGGQVPPLVSRVPFNPPVARVARPQEDQPSPAEPPARVWWEDSRSREPDASVTGAELVRRKSSVQKAVVTKFDDRLTSEVAESSRPSDHIRANEDMINKLVEYSFSCFFSSFFLPVLSLFRWSVSHSLVTLLPRAIQIVWMTKWTGWSWVSRSGGTPRKRRPRGQRRPRNRRPRQRRLEGRLKGDYPPFGLSTHATSKRCFLQGPRPGPSTSGHRLLELKGVRSPSSRRE